MSTSLPFFLDGAPLDSTQTIEEPDELAIAAQTEVLQSSLRRIRGSMANSPPPEDDKIKAQQRRLKIVKVKAVVPSERKTERLSEPASPLRRSSMRYSNTATTPFATSPSTSQRPHANSTSGAAPPVPMAALDPEALQGSTPDAKFAAMHVTSPHVLSPTVLAPEALQPIDNKVTLKETPLYVQRCISGGIGSPRQRAWSRNSGGANPGGGSPRGMDSGKNLKKQYAYDLIDPAVEVDRFQSKQAGDDDGACDCDYLKITADTRGFDYSRYHAHALFHACSLCQRQPSSYLCLHCLESFCPSHVERHTNRSAEGKEKCTLYINLLDITTSFDRIFWCERCKRFTWKFTDEYEPFTDQIAATKGTYLDDPVTDVWFKQYLTQLVDVNSGAVLAPVGRRGSSEGSPPNQSFNNSSFNRRRSSAATEQCQREGRASSPPAGLGSPQQGPTAAAQPTSPMVDGTSPPTNLANTIGSDAFQFLVEKWNTAAGSQKIASTIRGIGCSLQGWRSGQEDAEAAFTIEARNTVPGALDCSCAVFCVFDGHGGEAVAKIAAREIKRHLEREFKEAPPLILNQAQSTTPRAEQQRQQQKEKQAENGKGVGELNPEIFRDDSEDAVVLAEYFTNIFTAAFLKLDKELQDSEEGLRGDYNCVGCTACVVAITEDFVICANVGDSGAMLFHPAAAKKKRLGFQEASQPRSPASTESSSPNQSLALAKPPPPPQATAAPTSSPNAKKQTPGPEGLSGFSSPQSAASPGSERSGNDAIAIVPLSEAHRLADEKEANRIKAAGYNVVDDRIEGMLAVPRAFGDFDFKQCGTRPAEEQAVTALPDVIVLPRKRRGRSTEFVREVLEERDWTIITACDGIWDTLPADYVCKLVHHHLYPGSPTTTTTGKQGGGSGPEDLSPGNLSLGADPNGNQSQSVTTSRSFVAPPSNIPEGFDGAFIGAFNAVFDHCIAPKINDEGLGMDNMSLIILRPTAESLEDDEEDAKSDVSL